MKRIYLLEGPDGSGKSTLATTLARRLGVAPADLSRHGPYRADGGQVWRRYLNAMLPAYADLADVVMDRSWLSEPIYGHTYRGGANRITVAQRRALERVALGRGATLVLATARWPIVAANFRRRAAEGGEYLDDVRQLKTVWTAYRAVDSPRAFTPRVTRYNYEGTVMEAFADELIETQSHENLGPGIGAWRPGEVALLVGERPGGFGGRWHLPFVDDGGCSAWLAERLEAAGVPERDLYWVNAWDGPARPFISAAETDTSFLDVLRPRAIFLMGEVAQRWYRRNSGGAHCVVDSKPMTVINVEHPQAWKRFHAKKPYPLIKELQHVFR